MLMITLTCEDGECLAYTRICKCHFIGCGPTVQDALNDLNEALLECPERETDKAKSECIKETELSKYIQKE